MVLQSNIARTEVEPPRLFGWYLAKHYKFMLDTTLLPKGTKSGNGAIGRGYEYVVFLEDDLRISPDTIKYFHSMSYVMEKDDTIYCVSGHADNAFYSSTRNEMDLVRSSSSSTLSSDNHAKQAADGRITIQNIEYPELDFDFKRG